MALREFIEKHTELLNLEREAEIEETSALIQNVPLKELQRRGVCLLKLSPFHQCTGLYGRKLVTFAPNKGHGDGTLPAHNLTSGDIVGVSPSQRGGVPPSTDPSGIVSKVKSSSITVAFDHKDTEGAVTFEHDGLYRLTKLANDVTYRRLKRALSDLDAYTTGPASHLIQVLFGEAEPSVRSVSTKPTETQELQFFNDHLNQSQKEAVTFALSRRDIAVIHGPPGTGKTTTVVEIIRQAVKRKLKVLACAPSNVAVDNLVERLSTAKVPIVRLGHPARLLHSARKYALDAILASSDEARIVQDVRKEIDQTIALLSKSKQGSEKRRLRGEAKTLRKELRERERHAISNILRRADVVLATNTSASTAGPLSHLPKDHFDLVVIDECAQALEVGCWIPLQLSPCCVLAGDHQQLPPTILSDKAAADGLAVSLMERVVHLHGNNITKMLTTQYRMNSAIMRWSSDALYNGKLTADDSVAGHLLRDLPSVEVNEDTSTPLVIIDTAGCDMYELDLEDEVSKGNEGEAELVAIHVERLVKSGLLASEIAVIAPYNLQVELLRLRLSGRHPKLEIKSVDGFQGREKEAVVISLVRSNNKGKVGFLAEDRRINVAVTRARRHVAVICDSDTVRHHGFLRNLVEYFETHGEVRTAFQYQDELDHVSHEIQRPDYLTFRQNKPSYKKDGATKFKRLPPKRQQSNITENKTRTFDPETSAKREEELQEQVTCFSEDQSKKTLEFPATLNSHDRLIVHQVAEKLGLFHFSTGESQQRQITISKQQMRTDFQELECQSALVVESSTEICQENYLKFESVVEELRTENVMDVLGAVDQDETDITQENVDTKSLNAFSKSVGEKVCNQKPKEMHDVSSRNRKLETVDVESGSAGKEFYKCQFCKKKLPAGNVFLHEIHCEKKAEEKGRLKEASQRSRGKMDRTKQRNTLEKTTEEDFDKLMALAVESDGRCNFVKCKERVRVAGIQCQFCNRRYCFAHGLPEIHGCGELSKAHAKKLVHREGVVRPGSGAKEMKTDPTLRAHLERKLDKKRGEFEEKRTRKSAKKK